jgi:HlyD family secretion protein
MSPTRFRRIFPLLLALACGGDDGITATGTIEVEEVDLAPTQLARLVALRADEGDSVRAGDTLAILTQATLPADIAGREARLAGARAVLAEAVRGPRPAEIEQAEAQLRAAEEEAGRLRRDAERFAALEAADAISRQQLDQARSAADAAAARAAAQRETVRLLRDGVRPERIGQARAEVASAEAAVGAARATARDLTLVSPVSGVVLGRHARPGEVLGPGEPVLTVGETTRPWVRVYVSQRTLPLLRVGGGVVATLDAFPDRPFDGSIVSIADRAEFTPRVALTEEERDDLLFGVKVSLADSMGMLKPGLPITVRFDAADPALAAGAAGARP